LFAIKIQNATHTSVRFTSFLSFFGEGVDIKLKTLKVVKLLKINFLSRFFAGRKVPDMRLTISPDGSYCA